jgi:predicted transcriptional regulator
MTKTAKSTASTAAIIPPPTKHSQVVDLLSRNTGASLEEMSTLANWRPHSTRAFLTGLKKKGHVIESDKIDGVRRYRIVSTTVK